MFFDTPIYFLFLSTVVGVYWRLGHKAQNVFLLVASYFFYGWWDWRFLGLILASTVVDYPCAIWIDRLQNRSLRRWLLALSLALNLGFLGFFKYYNFFADSLVTLLKGLGVSSVNLGLLSVILPPGISFYTFQE